MRTATVALLLGVLLKAFVFGQDGRAVNGHLKGNLVANSTKDLAAARVGKPIILKRDPEEYDYEQDQEVDEDEEEEDDDEEEEEAEEIPHTTQRSKGDKNKRKKIKRKGVAHESGGSAAAVSTVNYKGGYKGGSKVGLKKHLKKYMLPLLLAYKLKFLTLIPLLIGGLVLIVASTGFAGFFFALFAVGVGLKKD